MDTAALSVSMSQASLGQQVSLAVTKLAMDTTTENSDGMRKMMELSVNPNVGQNFDVSI
jgi:hypothetical protein